MSLDSLIQIVKSSQVRENSSTILIILLTISFFYIAAAWVIYSKAGRSGWLSLIPIVNLYYYVKILGKGTGFFILCFIPGINIIPVIMMPFLLADTFNKDILFAFGLLLLPFIFIPILAFGKSQYRLGSVWQVKMLNNLFAINSSVKKHLFFEDI